METASTQVPILPLRVEIGGVGRYRSARSVEDLAAFLLGEYWPRSDKSSVAFHKALIASLKAMEQYVDASAARTAFVDASHAAGMHVLPDDTSEMKKTN
ncbi:DUF982 domain-containing protein [Rhizobium sp. Root1220]|uniref:DUF982 domain-containing protein n=1 Tax=Rhizobium sp. Root1220 TaxID=1736432 RepID=UPI0006F6B7A1|nr:DUF982 domain-containing protein [Rhizobium sp. Root1220]KQV81874.1 hypothetical protein ASC90_24800 [Rhizobium sp. Root1220]